MDTKYRIWYVYEGELCYGWWFNYIEKDLDMHILAYLEDCPGEFYDVEIV